MYDDFCLQRAYKGLKLPENLGTNGNETGLQRAYKGLKHKLEDDEEKEEVCLQRAYKGLKLKLCGWKNMQFQKVCSVPIRD